MRAHVVPSPWKSPPSDEQPVAVVSVHDPSSKQHAPTGSPARTAPAHTKTTPRSRPHDHALRIIFRHPLRSVLPTVSESPGPAWVGQGISVPQTRRGRPRSDGRSTPFEHASLPGRLREGRISVVPDPPKPPENSDVRPVSSPPAPSPERLTALLSDMSAGDRGACDALLDAVYQRLRSLAERKLDRERAGHTLQPTALVHEAYMKLVDQKKVNWQGRTHFYAIAAQAMHRVLIDHARQKKREKRGGDWRRVTLDDAFDLQGQSPIDFLALQEALEKMERLDPRQARVVELRLFGGLSAEEASELLEVSSRTVERDWKMGQAWLRRELSGGEDE
ncbi:MAG: sigma-70 family RNA polymerase sigma factor [Phycisphaerae bacterium]|nr:sigma-70 family RNA polymerase sigma factor [Phycisphaerae bacterium]NNF43529.1 sigma-70 family RNA polymerase sigma factor [Phycisphaerales bacterium]